MADNTWWRSDKELKPEQLEVLGLPDDRDYLVLGPPGSGKTNILLLRAAYLSKMQRSDLVVLMFTGSLREFVLRGAPEYRIGRDKVQTIERWSRNMLDEHGVRFDDLAGKDFGTRRVEMAKKVDDLCQRKPGLRRHVECILVDEVQDCLPEELANFRFCAKNVFFVGDTRQKIYRTVDVVDQLKTQLEWKELAHHYRNGHAICRAADAIARSSGETGILSNCNYREDLNPSKVEFFECATIDEQHAQMITQVQQQVKAYPGELIGVACPRRVDVDACRAALANSPLVDRLIGADDLSAADPSRVIFVSTMHDVKGLEFRAMHMVATEKITTLRKQQKRVAFTTVTRAKTRLSVWWTESLPPYLEQARDAVAAPVAPPAFSDLFPPGRS